jgi:hypothetical protein
MATLKKGTWDMNGNGSTGTLVIGGIGVDGALAGSSTALGNKVLGFWDEASRRLTFMRLIKPTDPSSFQVYTGYLMSDDTTLAGSFEAFKGSGATAERTVFGWLARLPPVVK